MPGNIVKDPKENYRAVNRYFACFTGIETITTSEVLPGNKLLIVNDVSSFSTGDYLNIRSNSNGETNYPQITNILLEDTLVLDRPLDYSYPSGNVVEKVLINFSVVGSLDSPKSFVLAPPEGQVWHLTRLLVSATFDPRPSDDRFFNLPILTNGLLLRQNSRDSTIIFTCWKNGMDMAADAYDLTYVEKGLGFSDWSGRLRWTFTKSDVIASLNGTFGHFLEFLVQDDLTDLTALYVKVQGHIDN